MNKRNTVLASLFFLVSLAACSHHEEEMPGVEVAKPEVLATSSNQPIRIEVSSKGYTPKTIGVKKGKPVALEFHRADSDNCGEKIVFPSLKLERDLPVGEKVLIEITPEKAGELKFTCGMDMFRGKLLVTE